MTLWPTAHVTRERAWASCPGSVHKQRCARLSAFRHRRVRQEGENRMSESHLTPQGLCLGPGPLPSMSLFPVL